MNSLNELKRKQIEIHEQYGSKYFIFIGPSNIKKATESGIFERYMYKKNQVPDVLLYDISKLEIYLIEYEKIENIKQGLPLSLIKWSTTDKSKL